MHPALLVLAAGMGSRYGGLKQIDPVGPSGESVLDYAVFDAIRAGFGRVVFIIRRDFEEIFKSQIGAKYSDRITVDYVFQSLNDLPSGYSLPENREKPWGTGHAVWCARDTITEPFAVINADDFYGRDAFVQLGQFLSAPTAHLKATESAPANFAMIGYQLANTLSENGTVSRGVCQTNQAGLLKEIVEHTKIDSDEVGNGKKYTGQEIVSLNCWGFTSALFAGLDQQFRVFLDQKINEPKSEFYLPEAVSTMIAQDQAVVHLKPTDGSWFGITYREDKPKVMTAINELVQQGDYPDKLF